MKIHRYALLLLFLVALPLVVAAQGTILTPNTPLIVALTEGKPVELIYTSAGEEIITVYVRSLEEAGELDTTLTVIAPDGTSIAQNDDHGTDRMDLAETDSLVVDLTLSAAGDYVIVVDTFSGVAQGSMEVLLTTDAEAQPTAQPTVAPEPTTAGDDLIEGSVDQGEVFAADFSAETDEIITITARGMNGFDPRVTLLDSKGRVLAENDDHGSGDVSLGQFDARIQNFTIPTAATYTVEVSGYDEAGGSFTLEITRGEVVPTETAVTTLQESVGEQEVFSYAFDAQVGDVYTIRVRSTSSNFDPLVAVYDPSDNLAAYNDDHGDPTSDLARFDSRITRWIILLGGRYTLEISGYQGSGGSFELTLERIAQGAPTGVPREVVYTGESDGSAVATQTFEAAAGEWVSIAARGLSGSFDPAVELVAPDGTVVASNTDHGLRTATLAFVDAYIPNYPISVEGEYTINVYSEDGNAGSFAITIASSR